MGVVVPYRTDSPEYSCEDRSVYHDRDECEDGERILPEHQNLKQHCAKYAELGRRSHFTAA